MVDPTRSWIKATRPLWTTGEANKERRQHHRPAERGGDQGGQGGMAEQQGGMLGEDSGLLGRDASGGIPVEGGMSSSQWFMLLTGARDC